MDPLSITSSIIAILAASGKTLEGVEKIWGLRQREKHFRDLSLSIKALNIQFECVRPALDRLQNSHVESPSIQVCLRGIEGLCQEATQTFIALERLTEVLKPTGSLKPKKAQWVHRRSELLRLKEHAKDITSSLTTSLSTLSNIQNGIMLDALRLKLEPSAHVALRNRNQVPQPEQIGPYLAIGSGNKISSNESIHTTDCENESLTDSRRFPVCAMPNANPTCKINCQCKCHLTAHASSPTWIKHVFGSFTIYGTGSLIFGRQPCNREHCRRSGSLYVQVSYLAPMWSLLRNLVICMRSESFSGGIPLYNICFPRVIPYTAKIWSLVEMGKVSELKDLFLERIASPYDIGLDGTSLLKYALIHSQGEVYQLLINLKASPCFRDQFGVMAVQPGIDRALCAMNLIGNDNTNRQHGYEFDITEEAWDQQSFNNIHLIIFKCMPGNLEDILRTDQGNLNSPDANGRTPLLWAAWRGDATSVNLLLKYGANIDKADLEGFTPLARASQGGHLSAVQILLQGKALIDNKTSWGHEPIHLATENKVHGHEIICELLEWGANPNAFSIGSGTPLHHAVANNSPIQTLKLLVDHGTDVDTIGENGDTAVMAALYCWNEPSFAYLLKIGARLDVVNKSGHNIIQLVVWSASTTAWDLIIEQAEHGTLGLIDTHALHDGHEIDHCYEHCRKLWYRGPQFDIRFEWEKFNRMLRACGFRHIYPQQNCR